jgi:hypothetical protein
MLLNTYKNTHMHMHMHMHIYIYNTHTNTQIFKKVSLKKLCFSMNMPDVQKERKNRRLVSSRVGDK